MRKLRPLSHVSMSLPFTILLAASLLSPSWAHAQHVHGQAELHLALDSEKNLQIEWKVPSSDVFGFESLGSSEKLRTERKAVIKQRMKTLLAPEKLFAVDGKAACSYEVIKMEAFGQDWASRSAKKKKTEKAKPEAGSKTAAKHDHKGHDHKEHDHTGHDHEHSDLMASFKLSCQQVLKDYQLEIRIIEHFPNIHRLSVILLGEREQKRWTSRDKRYSIPLSSG